jgi:hypothetical protein
MNKFSIQQKNDGGFTTTLLRCNEFSDDYAIYNTENGGYVPIPKGVCLVHFEIREHSVRMDDWVVIRKISFVPPFKKIEKECKIHGDSNTNEGKLSEGKVEFIDEQEDLVVHFKLYKIPCEECPIPIISYVKVRVQPNTDVSLQKNKTISCFRLKIDKCNLFTKKSITTFWT